MMGTIATPRLTYLSYSQHADLPFLWEGGTAAAAAAGGWALLCWVVLLLVCLLCWTPEGVCRLFLFYHSLVEQRDSQTGAGARAWEGVWVVITLSLRKTAGGVGIPSLGGGQQCLPGRNLWAVLYARGTSTWLIKDGQVWVCLVVHTLVRVWCWHENDFLLTCSARHWRPWKVDRLTASTWTMRSSTGALEGHLLSMRGTSLVCSIFFPSSRLLLSTWALWQAHLGWGVGFSLREDENFEFRYTQGILALHHWLTHQQDIPSLCLKLNVNNRCWETLILVVGCWAGVGGAYFLLLRIEHSEVYPSDPELK